MTVLPVVTSFLYRLRTQTIIRQKVYSEVALRFVLPLGNSLQNRISVFLTLSSCHVLVLPLKIAVLFSCSCHSRPLWPDNGRDSRPFSDVPSPEAFWWTTSWGVFVFSTSSQIADGEIAPVADRVWGRRWWRHGDIIGTWHVVSHYVTFFFELSAVIWINFLHVQS